MRLDKCCWLPDHVQELYKNKDGTKDALLKVPAPRVDQDHTFGRWSKMERVL